MARLADCKYFTADRFTVDTEVEFFVGGGSFASLTAVKGSGQVVSPENTVDFQPGDTLFIPADTGTVAIRGQATLISVTVRGE